MDALIKGTLTLDVFSLNDFAGLVKELTVKNPKYSQQQRFSRFKTKIPEYLSFYTANKTDNTISVPRSFKIDKYLDEPLTIKDHRSIGYIKISKANNIILRDYQKEVIDSYLALKSKGKTDIMINLKPGGGKTLIALYLASIIGMNVLVVCLTNQLIDQWIRVITDGFNANRDPFFPEWTAGKYDPKKDYLYDITFATYSQLSSADNGSFSYDEAFYERFGHIIFDEYHRAAAETYGVINDRATCFYKTTLTATFRRADGLHKILAHYISDVVESSKKTEPARVYIRKTGIAKPDAFFTRFTPRAVGYNFLRPGEYIKVTNGAETYTGTLKSKDAKNGLLFVVVGGKIMEFKGYKAYPKSEMVTATIDSFISSDLRLYSCLIKDIKQLLAEGRKIIVTSKNLKVLYLTYYFLDRAGIDGLCIVASDKQAKYKGFVKKLGYTLDEYAKYCMNESRVILGVDKIAKEGMDVDKADTLLITTPTKDPEQVFGRIDRDFEGKKEKVIYAYFYDVPIYRNIVLNDFKKNTEKLGHSIGYLPQK